MTRRGRARRRGGAVRAGARGGADRRRLGPCVRHHPLRDRHQDGRPARAAATSEETPHERHPQGPLGRRGRRRGRPPPAPRSESRSAAASSRGAAPATRPTFGSLRSAPITVVADDGVPLHVEVDEYARHRPAAGRAKPPELTVVFVHGYSLNLDSWHFQRAAYRGQVRTVFYDQRSHGRSGRSTPGSRDDRAARPRPQASSSTRWCPHGPIVLVGHSMGGMTIMALAEEHPELFGDRVVGVGLISTTAGGLEPHRIVVPMLPSTVGGAARRAADGGARPRPPHGRRRSGGSAARSRWWPPTSSPSATTCPRRTSSSSTRCSRPRRSRWSPSSSPTSPRSTSSRPSRRCRWCRRRIICGTADKLTSIGHSRKLHAYIAGSNLLECEGAGHMVIMERHDDVNAELDHLLAAAGDLADRGRARR